MHLHHKESSNHLLDDQIQTLPPLDSTIVETKNDSNTKSESQIASSETLPRTLLHDLSEPPMDYRSFSSAIAWPEESKTMEDETPLRRKKYGEMDETD